MNSRLRKLRALAIPLLLFAGAMVGTTAVAQKGNVLPACHDEVRNVRFIGLETEWPGGPNWSVKGVGPQTLVMNHSVTVSHGMSANVGVSDSLVSAAVGFDVNWSGTTGTSSSINIPAGEDGGIDVGRQSETYYFEIYKVCGREGGDGYKTGQGTAKKFVGLKYYPVLEHQEYKPRVPPEYRTR